MIFNKKLVAGIIITPAVLILGIVAWNNRGTEIQKVLRQLSSHIILPSETPSLATVKDPTQVKEAFLKQSKIGDKVLIFSKTGKIILFRPSINRIVDVGSVVIDPSLSEAKGARVVIRNGSKFAGAADTASAKLKQIYPNIATVTIEDASRTTFEKTIGIDLSSDQKFLEFSTAAAQLFGGQAGIIPLGESKTQNVDILIIIGNDFKN